MKPFLLLATRSDDTAADSEYHAFLRFTGLSPDGLRHIRVDRAPLPALDLTDWSGVILGGSPFNTSRRADLKSTLQCRVEADLSALVTEAVDRDFPFFGACYGVGTLGVHQGAVVDGTYREDVGLAAVTLTGAGRDDPLFGAMPPVFDAFVGHQEAVTALPGPAVLLATSGTCPVQAFRIRTNLYATQFHPELDAPGLVERLLVYRDAGYFAPERLDEVVASVRHAVAEHPHRLLQQFVRLYQT